MRKIIGTISLVVLTCTTQTNALAGEAGSELIDWVDDADLITETQSWLYLRTYTLADRVNSWFGDVPLSDGGTVAGSVTPRIFWREDKSLRPSLRFRIDARLPNIDLFIGRANIDDLLEDRQRAFSEDERSVPRDDERDTGFFAGLGREFTENTSARLGFRRGLRPYVQLRYQDGFQPTEHLQTFFSETVFLGATRGLGSTTSLNFYYKMSETLTLRWLNSTTISTRKDGWDWSTGVGPYLNLGWQQAIWLDLLASSNTASSVDVEEYGIKLSYKHPLSRNRLVAEYGMAHYWPRNEEDPKRGSAWGLNAQVTLEF